jgi:predicted nuclease of predicted toxin-antitoxin system
VRFLIDADLPRSTRALLEKYGHTAIDVRDIGLGLAADPVIASHALENELCLITGDFGFADIRNYRPELYHGIIVLELPRDATAKIILNLIEQFLNQPTIVQALAKRLVIIEAGRIRLRPPL